MVGCCGVDIDLLETHIGSCHPALVELVKQCLHKDPLERPSTEELLAGLQGVRVEVEETSGSPFKLDMEKVRLSKEVKEKHKEVERLTQQQVREHSYVHS